MGTICICALPTETEIFVGGAMIRSTFNNNLLDGIESNIEATERQIHQLRTEFASFLINGATGEQRRLTVQQLCTLEDNLLLLQIRRMYAAETTVH
jgi:uncharacterized protein involved in exopolysaccharide biosynthesis